MRRLLCWFRHDWQCLYRSEIRVPCCDRNFYFSNKIEVYES